MIVNFLHQCRQVSWIPAAGDGGSSEHFSPPSTRMLAFTMPAGFTRSQVEAIAALAQLELDEAEIELFARQLGDILDYANQVQRVDTTGVPPTASVLAGRSVEREDELRPSLDRREALANAPDPAPDAGFFRVPRVLG
jgi:aspartyl-tRNA(Asn)/glutamyl-tRNA(Gln) amidotransferase subunit C